MTVEQLIERLKEFPPWHEVRIDGQLAWFVWEEQHTRHPYVTIR